MSERTARLELNDLSFIFTETGIEVHGFPDAVKVIKLEGPLSRQLGDIVLHQEDLKFAKQCLEGINLVPEDPFFLREGLWRSALVHVMKCFGSNVARSSLPEAKILQGQPPEAKVVFDYFKNLRNKFIVHDENAYMQAMTGALINNGRKRFKVEQVVAFTATSATLEEANYGNLMLLIDTSYQWTVQRFDLLCKLIAEELEATDYEQLISRDPPEFRVPEAHEVANTRPK